MILSRAPYRISLGGGGTDLASYYSKHGGFILSAAINKYVYIYVNRPAADEFIRLKYSISEQVSAVEDIKHDLVRPALKVLKLGGSLEIASMADAPGGTGLGSSGTYLVALLAALHELKRERISQQALAEQAYHIEVDLAGHAAGKHDHYLAAFGGFTCLEIATDGRVLVRPLNIPQTTVDEFRNNTLLFYTGLTRNSGKILEAQRSDTSKGDSGVIDSLHRTRELGFRIRDALEDCDLDAFGRMLDEHWQNKKRRSPDISDPRIDRWYDLAKESGALGGKIIGAGGGGFLMLYCPNNKKAAVRQSLVGEGLREMGYDFDYDGAKVMINF